MQYVGETLQTLKKRMNGHRTGIKSNVDNILYNHFQGPCKLEDLSIQPIEIFQGDGHKETVTKQENFERIFGLRNFEQFIHMV